MPAPPVVPPALPNSCCFLSLLCQAAFKPITWAYGVLGPHWTAVITDAVVPHLRDLTAARAAVRAVLGAAVLALGLRAGSAAASVRLSRRTKAKAA